MPKTPVTQPTNVPTAKVATAGVTGAAVLVIVWLVDMFGVVVPPEVAAAAVLLLGTGAAYLRKERVPQG